MFSGIAAYPIVIYKTKKPNHITAIEISRECNKYAKENLKINKIPEDKITLIQGDVKKKIPKSKFDVIMMTRPNLKTTFLEQALQVSKKGTKIFYHGFCHQDDLNKLKQELLDEANKLKRKIKITKTAKAGDIAPYKYRYRVEIKVLN
jgi:tRNA G37 N-methylase Trm5